ncbi:TonB-dependent receptor family protein [Larkinella punicea]|uniref:TonB-dependent receptor n=1 Tax=Larkinella punicea TaxID=2315727 RepID=A0A368JU93_9BACT|nr:TonB-dependent receptor [Larkinella punicea]RCR70506.1 TonB-dependent receptor [Larkinella punicea]
MDYFRKNIGILGSTVGLMISLTVTGFAQSSAPKPVADTLRSQTLKEVNVTGIREGFTQSLPDVQGTYLLGGKRTEVVQLGEIDANIAEKNARQVFARLPGLFVYDMDGTGNQMNVATRGLDPHRSWEYNSRQNGVLTNSDMYGYPASHFSPPMESIERVELVRGTASLQYGAQFGGMLNYVTKSGDTTRRFGFETVNSVGSYGLRSTYNAIGGRIGKLTYYGYYYRRHSDGYRESATSNAQAQFMSLQYQATKRLRISAELGRSEYVYRIPGPLTEEMFAQNPQQATRNRNYFNPDIWVPSLRLDWQMTARTRLMWLTSAVLGQRNSVLFDALANVPDTLIKATGQPRNRQVDIDNFHSYTSELRLLHAYQLGNVAATGVVGIQVMNNDLNRRQQGKGTTGSDFDLSITGPFGRDLHFYTSNVAVFAESQFHLTPKLTVSPGIRVESGLTRLRGTISYYDPLKLPNDIDHRFALLGINAQYRFRPELKVYGGWSQAYRPVIFKDIIPTSVYEQVDKNLKDATGYNAEIGLEGYWPGLHVNVSAFYLPYRNRLGSLVLTNPAGESYVFRTNVGDSRTKGVEALVEAQFYRTNQFALTGFTSTAFVDARYHNARVSTGADNQTIDGNRVESAPRWTSRNGLTARYRTFSLTAQFSYVSETFSDALNTPEPTANGARGPVPAYGIWDLNTTWRIGRRFTVRGSINNLLNTAYFTKRPTFYPGPGIWPSDGRTGVLTLGIKL